MPHPILALREAIRARLKADAALSGLLGAARIHDAPPRGASPPYLVFEEVEATDWSTGSDTGLEQRLTLAVHAREAGLPQALAAIERVTALLHDQPLTLAGHRLINLRTAGQDVRRSRETGAARVALRLRAVTEAL